MVSVDVKQQLKKWDNMELLSLGPDELITNCSIFVKQGLQSKSNRNCLTWAMLAEAQQQQQKEKRGGDLILKH